MTAHLTAHFSNNASLGEKHVLTKRALPQEAIQRKKLKMSEIKKHVCSNCGDRFKTSFNLKRHFTSQHNELSYNCGECNRKFGRRDNLKRHINAVHEKTRPHQCSVCGKKFNQSTHRDRHFRTVHSQSGQSSSVNSSKIA